MAKGKKRKKIATITFHWANNYGAVLQAYALQVYLKKTGYDTEIIRYVPGRISLIQLVMDIRSRQFSKFVKEWRIRKFRKKELCLSKKIYFTNKALQKGANIYEKVICGSDQIWNEGFTNRAEGKPTLSYYLNFCNTDRIAYAVSFGTEKLREETEKLILPELRKFKAISVREKTGEVIVNRLGFPVEVVLDPTLLLEREDYEKLLENKSTAPPEKVFAYILHDKQESAIKICDFCKQKYGETTSKRYYTPSFGLYAWLQKIKNAELVVTNSFHGMVFSIIFQKKFIVVPVEGMAMNDRIYSLLEQIGLESRIIKAYDKEEIEKTLKMSIDWEDVNKKLQEKKDFSKQFLSKALKE